MASGDFTWVDGERLVRFGPGALADAPELLADRGFADYVLLSTERSRAVAPALVEGAATVLDVAPGPVPDAAGAIREHVEGRPLVALGGGRVIDSAKAIAGADGLESAAVPTTLSGAEMTRLHRMPAGVEDFALTRPSLVLADPELMASQPVRALAASAMNALGHAMEALYTPLANPIASLAALQAAALIAHGLAEETPAREELALGALLAGYATGSAGLAAHHAVCQTIVRTCSTPHAETNAVMLPHFAAAMAERVPRVIGDFGRALGAPGGVADATPSVIAALASRAGATKLSELGVGEERVREIVDASLEHPAYATNTPSPPDRAELTRLLERAL